MARNINARAVISMLRQTGAARVGAWQARGVDMVDHSRLREAVATGAARVGMWQARGSNMVDQSRKIVAMALGATRRRERIGLGLPWTERRSRKVSWAEQTQKELEAVRLAELSDPSLVARNAYRLPRSKQVDGVFVLDKALFPNSNEAVQELSAMARHAWVMRNEQDPVPPRAVLDAEIPVVRPNIEMLFNPPYNQAQITWLGHSSMLVQWQGWTVLSDPIFSKRCFPISWAGPKRVRRSPVRVADLPPVDVVLISHNHYDHLDLPTVRRLRARQPNAMFFVPLGLSKWMQMHVGVSRDRIVEMDWSEEVTLEGDASRPPLELISVPAQHWGARAMTFTDVNHCLWGSWIARTSSMTSYFGGDSGYCGEIFKRAGDLYGPIDLSAIPIGAYGSPLERWFHRPNHMDPSEAVQCHTQLRSRQSVAQHWGTFPLTGEPFLEPPKRLAKAAEEQGLPEGAFTHMLIGETRRFDVVRQSAETGATAAQRKQGR